MNKNKIIALVAGCFVVMIIVTIVTINIHGSKWYGDYKQELDYDRSIALSGSSIVTYDNSLTEDEELALVVAYFDSIGAKGVVNKVNVYDCDEPDETIIELGFNDYYSLYNNGIEYRVTVVEGNIYPLPNGR